MGSGYSGLLRDQYPLLTTKPLLQPEILHCRLAFLLSAQTQHGRWTSRAAVRATISERKRKHTEICSTKWKRFSFVSKPWPYCLWAKLASLFIIFCSCNRNVNAEGIPLRRWVWAAEHTWHTCGCGVWPVLGGIGRRDEGRGGSRESAYLRSNERWGVNVNKAFLTSLCAGPAVKNWTGRRSDPKGWGPRWT